MKEEEKNKRNDKKWIEAIVYRRRSSVSFIKIKNLI